jgi:hypothetical protein
MQATRLLGDGGSEVQLLGSHGRDALKPVEAKHGARQAACAQASAVVLPAALFEDGLDKFKIALHKSRDWGRRAV